MQIPSLPFDSGLGHNFTFSTYHILKNTMSLQRCCVCISHTVPAQQSLGSSMIDPDAEAAAIRPLSRVLTGTLHIFQQGLWVFC